MTDHHVLYASALAVGGFAGMCVGFYAYFLATESPGSWFTRATRLR